MTRGTQNHEDLSCIAVNQDMLVMEWQSLYSSLLGTVPVKTDHFVVISDFELLVPR